LIQISALTRGKESVEEEEELVEGFEEVEGVEIEVVLEKEDVEEVVDTCKFSK